MVLDLLFLLLFVIWYERRFLPTVATQTSSPSPLPLPQSHSTALSKDIKKHMFALISENNKLRTENQSLHKQLTKTEVVETLYQHFDVNVEKAGGETHPNPLIKHESTTITKTKSKSTPTPNPKDVLSQVIQYGPPSPSPSSPDDEDMFQNFFASKAPQDNDSSPENEEITFM